MDARFLVGVCLRPWKEQVGPAPLLSFHPPISDGSARPSDIVGSLAERVYPDARTENCPSGANVWRLWAGAFLSEGSST